MKIRASFHRAVKGNDDFYLIPAIAIGYHKSSNVTGYRIGVKLFHIIFSVRIYFINNGLNE